MQANEILQFFREVKPEISPEDVRISPPFKLFRYDKADDRYYFRLQDGATPVPFLSVTSFCNKSLPTSPFLIKWKADLGNEVADYTAKMKADYGTLMHIEMVEILRNGGGDFGDISDRAFEQAMGLGHKHAAQEWASEIVKDVMSFLQFAKEKELKVCAAEFPIASQKFGLGGCIDIVGSIKFGKGRVNCLIDLKSGRKGFWDSHKLQLSCYKLLWNEHYDDIFPVTHIFNFAPTDWRKEPKYKLENQSNNRYEQSARTRMQIAVLEKWVSPPKAHMEIEGRFELSSFDFNNHITKTEIK